MDLVRELRLRQWARQNYVPLEQRQSGWHPIVLDEMHRRDLEIHSEPPNKIAPVAETPPVTHEPVREPIPFEATQSITADESPMIEFVQHPWGWTFIPSDPGRYRMLHEGHSEIPRPHARAFFGNAPQHDEASYLFVMD
jgi:hypothetical protein